MKPRKGPNRRRIVINEEERRAGDFAYALYNKVHPHHGDEEIIAKVKRQLKGLRGERLKMTIKGTRVDEHTGDEHRFRITRHVNYANIWHLFGPGSAYASALHAYRDRHSGDELSIQTIDFDVVELDEVELNEE